MIDGNPSFCPGNYAVFHPVMGQSFPASLRAQPFVTYSYAHRTLRLRFYGNLQKFSRQFSFSFSSVSFLPFMVWMTFPRGTVFIMGPILNFFSQALTWKNTLRDACVCSSSNWCLSVLLALDKHAIDLRQMEQS